MSGKYLTQFSVASKVIPKSIGLAITCSVIGSKKRLPLFQLIKCYQRISALWQVARKRGKGPK